MKFLGTFSGGYIFLGPPLFIIPKRSSALYLLYKGRGWVQLHPKAVQYRLHLRPAQKRYCAVSLFYWIRTSPYSIVRVCPCSAMPLICAGVNFGNICSRRELLRGRPLGALLIETVSCAVSAQELY